jgi:Ca2+/Na+ antiporter
VFGQRATPYDIYGDGIAPGIGGLQIIVGLAFLIGLFFLMIADRDFRNMVFGYIVMLFIGISVAFVLFDILGKKNGIIVISIVAVFIYLIIKKYDEIKRSNAVLHIKKSINDSGVKNLTKKTDYIYPKEDLKPKTIKLQTLQLMTFRERLEKEKKDVGIKKLLRKIVGLGFLLFATLTLFYIFN